MSILVDQDTRLLVQGVRAPRGAFCVERMLAGGTRVVAGMADGLGGTWVSGVPVFDSVREAVEATAANAAVLCAPPDQIEEAILEASGADLGLIVCLSSGVPVWDMVRVRSFLRDKPVCLIGPNSAGVFTPGKCLAGVVSEGVLAPGTVGVVSRSGSLTSEVAWLLTQAGFGQSTVVCIGSGFIVGTGFAQVLAMFEQDPMTEQVVLIGEIGGQEEEQASDFIRDHMSKPVVAFIAGQTSPPGRKMGHAGSVIEGVVDTAQLKMDALERARARVARSMDEIPTLLDRRKA